MGLVAEFNIHCEALPLVEVAAAVPRATLILDIQFNHGDRPLFIATVTDGSQAVIEEALTDAFDVGEWTLIGQAGKTRRYQVSPALDFEEQLGEHIEDLSGLESLATTEAIIERIEVKTDGWRQSGWFADREAFNEFSSFWQQNAGFRLHRLTRDGESEPPGDGLSDRQHEALRTAYEMGYFDIPRKTSLDRIGKELDISASSVSERLRRAQTQFLQDTMAPTWPPLPE
ncbi:HTH-10 family transcription regulator [Natrialba magadii ATCC 43099]|uniref:Bacterio-opsin activator HTH domain-containing protein n=1 Tax=Natrialba magadii (strain ATCC 43099 / DSM 3394 / CCM 3739 / CIP 104546 / IAM 13178 / JCM 8861 / NBRC 102185 / NCIMB 2190 / MS3) TaxID=547559 RepID=D3SW06_NATMM|nr:helix-turn-helix domain-containing protein [Natrialba magadii]ADD05667.1 HTH-10 family transcription regulator [Natrialba magadii ATCC 43099]ELY29921.1 bacterio-opsin activator HTH domain-containing protein [Natrialba magadii ATCC 43099]